MIERETKPIEIRDSAAYISYSTDSKEDVTKSNEHKKTLNTTDGRINDSAEDLDTVYQKKKLTFCHGKTPYFYMLSFLSCVCIVICLVLIRHKN